MYEQKKKRRVRFNQWDAEYYKRQVDEKITPAHPKGFGWLEKFGWFAGYGLAVDETGDWPLNFTVGIIENDYDQIELIPVHDITFMPS